MPSNLSRMDRTKVHAGTLLFKYTTVLAGFANNGCHYRRHGPDIANSGGNKTATTGQTQSGRRWNVSPRSTVSHPSAI
jgi:hypothetical protein